MPIGGLLALGAGALGAVSAREQNRMQREMAREQMAFQERMSSTAYQRAVADMRAAGLNPMLAFDQGGASSPGGAQAQMVSPLGGAVSSALSVKRLKEDIRTMKSLRYMQEHQGHRAAMESQVANAMRYYVQSQTHGQDLTNQILKEELSTAKLVGSVSRDPAARYLEWMRRVPGLGAMMSAPLRRR